MKHDIDICCDLWRRWRKIGPGSFMNSDLSLCWLSRPWNREDFIRLQTYKVFTRIQCYIFHIFYCLLNRVIRWWSSWGKTGHARTITIARDSSHLHFVGRVPIYSIQNIAIIHLSVRCKPHLQIFCGGLTGKRKSVLPHCEQCVKVQIYPDQFHKPASVIKYLFLLKQQKKCQYVLIILELRTWNWPEV